jgi:hypothetical protein
VSDSRNDTPKPVEILSSGRGITISLPTQSYAGTTLLLHLPNGEAATFVYVVDEHGNGKWVQPVLSEDNE